MSEVVKQETSCPPKDTLEQMLDGTLSDVRDIELHLQSCRDCQSKLDTLSKSDLLQPFRKHEKYHADHSAIRFLDQPTRPGDLGTIDEFNVEAEIGRGGAGVVFRGFDPKLKRHVAIKVLSSDGSFRSEARFERESQVAAKIQNDHVVNVHSTGRTIEGRPYIVMPLVSGDSLKQVLAKQVPSEKKVASIIGEIANGLHAIHEAGIVHRDVKPANILMDEADGRAKLTDFGLAQDNVADVTLTQTDVLCGTPEYMSPEQSQGGEVDAQSDIYSLGITLYESLTGTTPFRGGPLNVLQQHCNVEPLRPKLINPEISRNVETICLKAISKEPARRYESAKEFADDLQRLTHGQPILARESPWWEKLALWSKRNRNVAIWAATSAILLIALGIGSSLAAWNLNQANDRILAEKQKATDAEQRAVQDRTAAVSSLTDLVDSLYDDLSDNAATIKAREKLVDSAMHGLQSVSTVEGDVVADRTAFLGSLRIADLAVLKGDTQMAAEHYGRSIELARKLAEAQPDNDGRKRDLARAISKLGVLNRHDDPELSSQLNKESELILSKILDRNPGDTDALTQLVAEKGCQLELLRNENVTDYNAVIDYAHTILPDLDRLLQQDEIDKTVFDAGYLIYFQLGRAYLESGDGESASEFFESAREQVAASLAQSPNNFRMRSASATLDRAASMAAGLLGQMDKSLEMYLSAIATLKQLSAANPDDSRLRLQVASTLSLGSSTLLYKGKFDEGTQVLHDAETIYEELIELAPTNEFHKTLFIENRLRGIFFDLAIGNWQRAFEQSNDTLEFLNRIVDNTSENSSLLNHKLQLNDYLQTTGWLVGQPLPSAAPYSKHIAMYYAFYPNFLKATSFDLPPEFLKTVKQLELEFNGKTFQDALLFSRELTKDNPMLRSQWTKLELVIFGKIAGNCAENATAGANKEMQNRSRQCIDHCIELLKKNPLDPLSVLGQPDLEWFRDTEEFNAILPELQAAWRNELSDQ